MKLKAEVALFVSVVGLVALVALVFGSSAMTILDQWWFWVIAFVVAGVPYALLTMRSQRTLGTPLEEGERLIEQVQGGRRLADEEKPEGLFGFGAFSTGSWYLTNRRLIYEGKIKSSDLKRSVILPGWMKSEEEAFSYPLNKLRSLDLVDRGTWGGKSLAVTFQKENASLDQKIREKQVHVVTRRIEELKEAIQRAADSARCSSKRES